MSFYSDSSSYSGGSNPAPSSNYDNRAPSAPSMSSSSDNHRDSSDNKGSSQAPSSTLSSYTPQSSHSSQGYSSGSYDSRSGAAPGSSSTPGQSGQSSSTGSASHYQSSSGSSSGSSRYGDSYGGYSSRDRDRDHDRGRDYDRRDRDYDSSSSYRGGSSSGSSSYRGGSSSGSGSGSSNSYRGSSYGGNSSYGGSSSYGNSSYGGNTSYGNAGPGGFGGGNDRMNNVGRSLREVTWSDFKLKEFVKDFYVEHEDVASMTPQEVDDFRRENNMIVTGTNVPKPIRTFTEASFPDYLLTELKNAGFTGPTPIQSQGWPMALSGRDVVGISATGSGKTLSFVLPAIIHINAQPLLEPGDGPIVLVLSPTRELVVQTMKECEKFCSSSRIKYSCVYGGNPKSIQARELRAGVEVLIATPGRLIDFLETGTTNLRRVTYLVLDEADRMLDMGFEHQIRKVLSQIRPDRQTLLWSATWPTDIQALARDYTHNPIQVTVGSLDLTANENITQIVKVLPSNLDKKNELLDFLRATMDGSKILIFATTKRTADDLQYLLRQEYIQGKAIHGDKKQEERDYVLNEFKTGRMPIMIATDVASRGIDVKDIKYVINYDFPTNLEDYIHRVGRTGRAGAVGTAISFLTPDDSKKVRGLIDILKKTKQDIPQELYDLTSSRYGGGGGGSQGGYRNYRSGGGNSYRGGGGGGYRR